MNDEEPGLFYTLMCGNAPSEILSTPPPSTRYGVLGNVSSQRGSASIAYAGRMTTARTIVVSGEGRPEVQSEKTIEA